MLSAIARGWNALLELLFPACCLACDRKLLGDDHLICSDCMASIYRTEHATLPHNGIDMLFEELFQKNKYNKLRQRYQSGAAFAYYNRNRGKYLRTLIERGKFGSRTYPEVFRLLGRQAAQEYIDSDLFDDVDLLVPVPLHHRRLRERGFNQAEWICLGMSEVLHIPIDTQHLVRVKNNPHQSRSLLHQRSKNVDHIFEVRYPEEWKNKHILLVDDVITSGSTMFACMKCLFPIRGCRVSVFSLGWAHN